MSGKTMCYLDCVSPYSYFALLYLEENRETLATHNVEIDIVPVFLGSMNVGSPREQAILRCRRCEDARLLPSPVSPAARCSVFRQRDIRTSSFPPSLTFSRQCGRTVKTSVYLTCLPRHFNRASAPRR
ncbi:hypothetical protein BU25DRAFT_80120 [Macroventuria anomochaeta]|uniref:Uncharacterized protein n=1 Tax=Macroventuria anomochaeta TaxID=301207 RepID=A0ACB6SED1_9PLEO|nr:uncharacterized protein BU25DRAFT_80120 [Macroventuria anomochaeta]KAF2632670.1 hypothetical protein BU25DRAFT_80120 [Macroventuria anomochaeta]